MKEKKKPIFIIGVIVLVLAALAALVVPKFMDTSSKKDKDKIDTGSEYGDKYAKYLKDKIFEEIDSIKASLINFDDKDDPEMLISYKDDKEEYTMVLYIADDEVKATPKYKNTKPTVLYSVKEDKKEWYLETTEENDKKTYEPIAPIIKEEATEQPEKTTITKDENFDKEYIEVEVELPEKEITEDDVKDLNDIVDDYKETDSLITEEQEQAIQEKVEEIKKAEKMEAAKITSSDYKEKIGNHIKYFVGIYRGADYGWPEVFEYKDVTGKVKVPGQHEYDMVYEIVGLKSLNDLQAKLEEYILKSKIPTEHPITREFKEYNGKVYRVRGGIGSGDYFDLKKTKILSSENGITKVKLFEYRGLGPEGVVEEVTLTITYNAEKNSYQITDYSIKEMR